MAIARTSQESALLKLEKEQTQAFPAQRQLLMEQQKTRLLERLVEMGKQAGATRLVGASSPSGQSPELVGRVIAEAVAKALKDRQAVSPLAVPQAAQPSYRMFGAFAGKEKTEENPFERATAKKMFHSAPGFPSYGDRPEKGEASTEGEAETEANTGVRQEKKPRFRMFGGFADTTPPERFKAPEPLVPPLPPMEIPPTPDILPPESELIPKRPRSEPKFGMGGGRMLPPAGVAIPGSQWEGPFRSDLATAEPIEPEEAGASAGDAQAEIPKTKLDTRPRQLPSRPRLQPTNETYNLLPMEDQKVEEAGEGRKSNGVCDCITAALAPIGEMVRQILALMGSGAGATPAPAPEAPAEEAKESQRGFFGYLKEFTEGLAGIPEGLARFGAGLTGTEKLLDDARRKTSEALAEAAKELATDLKKIGEVVKDRGKELYEAAIPKNVQKGISSFGKSLGKAWKGISRLAGSKGVKTGIKTLGKSIGKTARGAVGIGKSVAGAARKAGGAVKGGLEAAFQAPIDAFNRMTSAASGFVEALAPAELLVFRMALRDLNAAIGVALQPVIQFASSALKEFGAAILPVAEQFRPVFESLKQSLGPVVQAFSQAFGSVMQALLPAFQGLAVVVDTLQPVFQAFYAAISGIAGAIQASLKAMFGSDLGDVFKTVKSALGEFARVVLVAVASVVKFISSTAGKGFIEGTIKALAPEEGKDRKSAEGLAAAVNPQTGGIGDIIKAQMKASLLAGGEDQNKKNEVLEWQKKAVEQLQMLRDKQTISLADINKVIIDIYNYLTKDNIIVETAMGAGERVSTAWDYATAPARGIGDYLGSAIFGGPVGGAGQIHGPANSKYNKK